MNDFHSFHLRKKSKMNIFFFVYLTTLENIEIFLERRHFLPLEAFRNRFEYRSSRSVLESIPKGLQKSPCACRILKNDLIL